MNETLQTNDHQGDCRRQYFRLIYPRGARLALKTPAGLVLEVIDLSERGLRLEYDSSRMLRRGQSIDGRIHFHDGSSELISGRVVRTDTRGAAVQLDKGIKMRDMIQEQLFVKRRYPMFLAEIAQP